MRHGIFPGAQELVRENRRNSQDRIDAFPVDGLWGGGFAYLMAVVLAAGLRYAFAEATAEGLWLQVSALLPQLGVLSGERRLLVLGDLH